VRRPLAFRKSRPGESSQVGYLQVGRHGGWWHGAEAVLVASAFTQTVSRPSYFRRKRDRGKGSVERSLCGQANAFERHAEVVEFRLVGADLLRGDDQVELDREWAIDIVFRTAGELRRLYPRLTSA
jgi:hypothetical protein